MIVFEGLELFADPAVLPPGALVDDADVVHMVTCRAGSGGVRTLILKGVFVQLQDGIAARFSTAEHPPDLARVHPTGAADAGDVPRRPSTHTQVPAAPKGSTFIGRSGAECIPSPDSPTASVVGRRAFPNPGRLFSSRQVEVPANI